MTLEEMKVIQSNRALQVHGILFTTQKVVNMWYVWLELIRCGLWISRLESVKDIVVVVEKETKMLIQAHQHGHSHPGLLLECSMEVYNSLLQTLKVQQLEQLTHNQ